VTCVDRAHNLALALYCGARFKEAAEALKEVIALNPDYVDAIFSLGIGLSKSSSIAPAVEALRYAVRLNPADVRVDYHLGMAHLGLKQKELFWQQYSCVKSLESEMAVSMYEAFYNDPLPKGQFIPSRKRVT